MIRRSGPLGPILIVGLVGLAVPILLALSGSESSGDLLGVVGVVGFIALSFVFARKLGRGLLRGFANSDVIERGEPATAVVTSMAETGTTVNQPPVVESELRVTRPGGKPYDTTVKQMLPRLLLARVQPGTAVTVKVLPEDPSRVGIDWDSPAGGGAVGSTVPEGLLAGTPVADTVYAEAFLSRARRARAEIDQMSETGMTVPHPRTGVVSQVYAFVVTVKPDGEGPYLAKLLQGVPPDIEGRVGPGATVPVGINRDDPSDVAIEWDSHKGPA